MKIRVKNFILSLFPEVFGDFAWSRGRCSPCILRPPLSSARRARSVLDRGGVALTTSLLLSTGQTGSRWLPGESVAGLGTTGVGPVEAPGTLRLLVLPRFAAAVLVWW